MRDGVGGGGGGRRGMLVFCAGRGRIRLIEVNAKSLRLKRNMGKGLDHIASEVVFCIYVRSISRGHKFFLFLSTTAK
jgi:hypothetical protein